MMQSVFFHHIYWVQYLSVLHLLSKHEVFNWPAIVGPKTVFNYTVDNVDM